MLACMVLWNFGSVCIALCFIWDSFLSIMCFSPLQKSFCVCAWTEQFPKVCLADAGLGQLVGGGDKVWSTDWLWFWMDCSVCSWASSLGAVDKMVSAVAARVLLSLIMGTFGDKIQMIGLSKLFTGRILCFVWNWLAWNDLKRKLWCSQVYHVDVLVKNVFLVHFIVELSCWDKFWVSLHLKKHIKMLFFLG